MPRYPEKKEERDKRKEEEKILLHSEVQAPNSESSLNIRVTPNHLPFGNF